MNNAGPRMSSPGDAKGAADFAAPYLSASECGELTSRADASV
jgi:hypothetical protein